MFLRHATLNDFEKIVELLNKSIQLLKSENIDQWQDNMPNPNTFREDIKENRLYVLILKNQVVGMATIHETEEEDYKKLVNGSWINEEKYTAIHRFSIDTDFAGQKLGDILFSNLISLSIQKGFKNIRIDTHKDNLRMQHLILKNDFKYCGDFFIAGLETEKNFRLAYQFSL